MPVLHRDIETRSTLDLTVVGSWRYATHPTTDVWCVTFAVDDGPEQIWYRGEPVPEVFFEAARDPAWTIWAHNDQFERTIEQHILAPRYGWPIVPIEQHRCTMAMALASALPAKLETVAEVLSLKHRKDAEGHKLMLQMAKPRKPRKGEAPMMCSGCGSTETIDEIKVRHPKAVSCCPERKMVPKYYWNDELEKILRLGAYCKQDGEVEREASHRLPPLSAFEQLVWTLDAVINDRGFHTDGPLLEAASRIAAEAGQAMQDELARITEGALTSTDQVAAMQTWLAEHGCEVKDIQKGTLAHALRRKDLDPVVRRVLELRRGAAHAAATKIDALLAWRSPDDGRVRGTLQFHGAGPGRWTGRGPQPQNFKRDADNVEAKIAAIATGDFRHVASLFPQPLEIVGDVARATVCAASGHRLLIGDFSGRESRDLAWVAGETTKLDQWRKFDETGDPRDEPYYQFGLAFNLAEAIRREKGKTADLAFGFMGSVGAWDKLAPEGDTSTEADKRRYQQIWRSLHPQTVVFWEKINRVTIQAVRQPGQVITSERHRLSVVCEGDFLRITLPSGRRLSYPFPRLGVGKYGDPVVIFKDSVAGKFTDCRFGQGAWPGLWTENIVQATARDLLAAAIVRLEAAGYPVVLHVHDEVVCEVPIGGSHSLEEFKRLLVEAPAWAAGMPIAAKVREGARFSKPNKPISASSSAGAELADAPTTDPGAPIQIAPEAAEIPSAGDDRPPCQEPEITEVPPEPDALEELVGRLDSSNPPIDSTNHPQAGQVEEPAAPPPLTWEQIQAAFNKWQQPDEAPSPANGKGSGGNGYDPEGGMQFNSGSWPSLVDLIGRPLLNGKVCCLFHDDPTPSCHIYPDHFHCYGCNARGNAVDWLTKAEKITRDAALHKLNTWSGPRSPIDAGKDEEKAARKLELATQLWDAARPIAGTLAERYLTETRRLDLSLLPDIGAVLRFHATCPFGGDNRHPCLIALFRDVATDEPAGIHRIALTADAQKISRMMLGSWSAPRAIKLWPAGRTLAAGEGIETTLAAAARCVFRGAPLYPAWAMGAKDILKKLPPLVGVERLIILADNDANGQGQTAARACAGNWRHAGREVVVLTPQQADSDFNDLVRL